MFRTHMLQWMLWYCAVYLWYLVEGVLFVAGEVTVTVTLPVSLLSFAVFAVNQALLSLSSLLHQDGKLFVLW